jgi:hypothetical protein
MQTLAHAQRIQHPLQNITGSELAEIVIKSSNLKQMIMIGSGQVTLTFKDVIYGKGNLC